MDSGLARNILSGLTRRFRGKRKGPSWLLECHGVVHVGANDGSERYLYQNLGLDVLWVEPIPTVFDKLSLNIRGFPKQRAIRALVSDADGEVLHLKISNNGGASSSVFEFAQHRDIWPDVKFIDEIEVVSTKLPTLLRTHQINEKLYDTLILDTQGAELAILKGAASMLRQFRYIQAEAATFESYKGGAQLADIEDLLSGLGFSVHAKTRFAQHASGGAYVDVVFKNEHYRAPDR